MQFAFAHESLDVYQLALDVARWVATARFGSGNSDLRDQAVRASRSIVLNVAEGRARGGDAGRHHLRIALGSAAEVSAVLDLVALPGASEQQTSLRRVGAMLARMAR
jgi:four helix bundle protein